MAKQRIELMVSKENKTKETCDKVGCKLCLGVRTSRIKPEKRGDDELVMIVII